MTPGNGLKRSARERSRESVSDFWRDYKGFIAWWVLVLVIGISQIQIYVITQENKDAIASINAEREERLTAQNSINIFFCEENNKQNATLGKLLAISLKVTPSQSELTPAQRQQLRDFKHVEHELNTPTNCRKVAAALARALGVNQSDINIRPLLTITVSGTHQGQAGSRHASGSPKTEGSAQATPHGTGSTGTGGSSHGGSAGGHEGVSPHPPSHQGGHHHHPAPAPAPTPAPAPAPAPSPAPPPPEQGNEGKGNENRLKVCPKLPLLPKCVEAGL